MQFWKQSPTRKIHIREVWTGPVRESGQGLDTGSWARVCVYNVYNRPAAQRPSGPAAQRPSGMTCARREAGARRPAPSTSADSPRRPEPRPGRFRARLFFLPALALLLGALGLFAAAPAQAQVWSATLTADQGSSPATTYFGCSNSQSVLDNCSSSTVLTEDEFTHGGTTYVVEEMYWRDGANLLLIQISSSGTALLGSVVKTALSSLTLNVDGAALAISAGRVASSISTQVYWTYNPATDWTDGRKVSLILKSSDTPPAAPTDLTFTPADSVLGVAWSASTGATGYDVHYTSAAVGTVGNDAAASGSNAATAWVAVKRSGTTASQTISSLSNGTAYRVRVRTRNAGGSSAWVFGSGTPALVLQWPTATVSYSEGADARQFRIGPSTIAGAVSGTLTYAPGSNNPAVVARGDSDLEPGYATSFSFAANANPTITIAKHVSDRENEEHETFTVTINAGTGYTVGTPATLTVTILDDDYPVAPSGSLSVSPGNGNLTVKWDKTSGPVTGYRLRYKKTSNDLGTSTILDQSPDWVTSTPTGRSAYITGLTNWTTYEVQVRATDGQTGRGNGWGDWSSSKTGTPSQSLSVSPGNAQLQVSWRPPPAATGYDVHYTSSNAVDPFTEQLDPQDEPGGGWVAVTRSGTTASQTISSLTNGGTYRVRVRAWHADRRSGWVFGRGTPRTHTVSFSAAPNPVAEGSSVTVTVTLSKAAASALTIPVTLTAGTAETTDYGALTSIGISSGATAGTGTITTAQDTDAEDETFTVALGALPSGYVADSANQVEVTIEDDEFSGSRVTLFTLDTVDEGGSPLTVSATLEEPAPTDVEIRFTGTLGTAELTDFAAASQALFDAGMTDTIPAGEYVAYINIVTEHDDEDEDDTFTVSIDTSSLPSGYGVGSKISHTVTIDDDERHNPDPTLLTGLTIHDGTRALFIKSNRSGDAVGLGRPGETYTVQVSPGRRWIDVTPVWTNTAITSVTGSTRYYDSAASVGSTLTWSNSSTTQRLDMHSPLGGSGHPLLTLTVNGVTSQPYEIRFQHNSDWKSTHDRLSRILMSIPSSGQGAG